MSAPAEVATLPAVTSDKARRARARAIEHADEARRTTELRNAAIKVWRTEGGTLKEIGEAVGLSHTAIRFICDGRPARRVDQADG